VPGAITRVDGGGTRVGARNGFVVDEPLWLQPPMPASSIDTTAAALSTDFG
jgi:hypothetical protein